MKPDLKKRLDHEFQKDVPNPFAPEPKDRESEPLPDIRDVIEDRVTALKLSRLVKDSADLAAEEKRIRAQRSPITKSIKDLLTGAVKFMCQGNRVTYFNAPRRELSPRRLKELGVPEATIRAAYTTKNCWTLKITPPGAKEEEDE